MARTARIVREYQAIGAGKGVKACPQTVQDTSKGRHKKRKYRPGTIALREIRKYQKSADLLVPKIPFMRLVRELGNQFMTDVRFTKDAVDCLQVAMTKVFWIFFFEFFLHWIHFRFLNCW